MNVVLFGPPGAGKGTQAALLHEHLGLAHFSTGEEFRRHIASESALGQRIRSIVESGELVPDDIVLEVVERALDDPMYARGVVFDGFPRTLEQARSLDHMLSTRGRSIGIVLTIEVPEDELVRRMLQRGRSDDTEQVIRERLRVYEQRTAPVLDYYAQQGKLRRIAGDAPIEDVHRAIVLAIESLTTKEKLSNHS
ncbi:MAG: adenylate kinase [Chlorobi bacterium]|nr:adenylate kinase [Chlorobiota bacterium]